MKVLLLGYHYEASGEWQVVHEKLQLVCDIIRCPIGVQASGAAPKRWSNAELGTPEFFEWLNTIPPDAAQRLGE